MTNQKKKLPLLLLTGFAAVLSIIVSLSIDNKYKSEVILFPAASSSVSHDLLAMNLAKKEILKLGEDEEVEQLLPNKVKKLLAEKEAKLLEMYAELQALKTN